MSARNYTAAIGIDAINSGILKRIFSRPLAFFNDRLIVNYGRVNAIFFNSRVGPVDFSYITEIFLKMYLIKAKHVKFGHPNKQASTPSKCVLRKTLKGWAIYPATFVVHLSFRVTKLQNERLGIQINDLSLD